MKFNKLILLGALGFCSAFAGAQTASSTDKEMLVLGAWVSDQIDGMPAAAKNNLENKLNQIITASGMATAAANSRFIITANVAVLNKDVTPTAPPMQAYSLDVTLYIGDGVEGKAFATYNTSIKGVGENDTKAYMAALKNLKTNDPAYQGFIDKGKGKIIDYYNTQCDVIIKEAKALADLRQFDEAMWKLTSVPTVCTQCWDKSMAAAGPIFQQKIDFECKTKLTAATNIWNASQSWDAAEQVGAILSTIDPKAACMGEVKAFAEKIAKRIQEVDKREWSLKYDKEVGLEKDRINAYKEVGTAYGKNQPKNVTYKSMW